MSEINIKMEFKNNNDMKEALRRAELNCAFMLATYHNIEVIAPECDDVERIHPGIDAAIKEYEPK